MKEKIEFKQIRSFEGIIADTLFFIRQNIKPLLKTFFSLCGFFILGGLLSTIAMQLHVNESLTSEDIRNSSPFSTIFTWRYLMVILFSLANYTAMYTSIFSFVALYIAKGNIAPTVEEVWGYFKTYFFKIMGSLILIYIIWVICFMLCIVPGIYVTPAFSLLFAIMIFENVDFGTAFSRSFALVKENWWITFATLLVVGIMTVIFSLVIYLPSIILFMVQTFSGGAKPLANAYEIFIAISQYLSQVFIIVPLVATAFIYFNLVEQKESRGLLERMENFGTAEAPVSHPDEDY
jgi:hypothetical protein